MFVPEPTTVWIGQPGTNPCGLAKLRVIKLGSDPSDVADCTGIEALAYKPPLRAIVSSVFNESPLDVPTIPRA